MAINREELKKKAMKAASAEEVMEIVRAAGEEITAEEAKKFFETLKKSQADQELSLDELEAVSGGARNAATEGCAATVEAGRSCFFTDFCAIAFTMYDVYPVSGTCSQCGGAPVYYDDVNGYFVCSRCGCRMDRYGNVIHEAKQGDFPDFKF